MSGGVDPNEILNVFRELEDPYEQTLTTDDLVDELPVEKRTIQKHFRQLESDNKLVLASEGKPNHWRLSDTEAPDPVYDPRLAKAKRWGLKARKIGNWSFLVSISILAAVGLITSNHVFANVVGMTLPLINAKDVVEAALLGSFGSFLFLVAAVAYIAAFLIPSVVDWWIENPVPERVE